MPTDDKRLAAVIVQHKSVADWVACLRRCSPSPGVVGTEQMYSTALSHLYRVFLQAAWSLVMGVHRAVISGKKLSAVTKKDKSDQ